MEHVPRVTILMPTYGRPTLIGQAIRSAQAQAFRNWEMIIVDDHPEDATERVVAPIATADPRIGYFRIPRRGRIAVVSNWGLARARGEYIALLDDDDYWLDPEKLAKQVAFLDAHPECVGCGGGFLIMDAEGREKARVLKPESHEAIRRRALVANPVANLTAMFRYETAKRAGFYDETMAEFADWDFWLKLGLAGKLYNFPEHLAAYRMWEGGASFKKQRGTARSALRIVWRYRRSYPGFLPALFVASAYVAYTYLPEFIKRFTNPGLSRLKKAIFAS